MIFNRLREVGADQFCTLLQPIAVFTPYDQTLQRTMAKLTVPDMYPFPQLVHIDMSGV